MLIDGFEQRSQDQYVHRETGCQFTLIGDAEFLFGMSTDEEELLREHASAEDDEMYEGFLAEFIRTSRPNRCVRLAPFLIANFPLTVDFVTARWGFSEIQLHTKGAAYVPDSVTVVPLLSELGFRLPSETEWEYCHRATVPIGMPGEEALAFEPADSLIGFGCYSEIVADSWHEDLTATPDDGTPYVSGRPRVVRGGAINDYPWQGCGEWLQMMPFYRYCEFECDLLSVRPAYSVPIHR